MSHPHSSDNFHSGHPTSTGLQRSNIHIQTRSVSNNGHVDTLVTGALIGRVLAIHQSLDGYGWSIVHVSTGLKIGRVRTKHRAAYALRKLEDTIGDEEWPKMPSNNKTTLSSKVRAILNEADK